MLGTGRKNTQALLAALLGKVLSRQRYYQVCITERESCLLFGEQTSARCKAEQPIRIVVYPGENNEFWGGEGQWVARTWVSW